MVRRTHQFQMTEYPLYITYEGMMVDPDTRDLAHCFVLLGRDSLTLELKSSTGILPGAIMETWIAHLGPPVHEPITHARGLVSEEPSGEMILAATWAFSPEEREPFKTRIEKLLTK